MTRGSVLMALALAGAFLLSARASADAPRPSDIEACNKEAAAAATPSTGAPSGDGTTTLMINGRTSAEQPAMSGAPGGAPGAASRQAFAACLARHGYYKGYYR